MFKDAQYYIFEHTGEEMYSYCDDDNKRHYSAPYPIGTIMSAIIDIVTRGIDPDPNKRKVPTYYWFCDDMFRFITFNLENSISDKGSDLIIKILHLLSFINICTNNKSFFNKENTHRFFYASRLLNTIIPKGQVTYVDKDFHGFFLTDARYIEQEIADIANREQTGEAKKLFFFNISNLLDICLATLSWLAENNMQIKACKHCGRLFVPSGRSDTMYCDYPSPEMKNKTCREYVPYMKWQEKERGDEARKLHKQVYNQKNNLYRRWKEKEIGGFEVPEDYVKMLQNDLYRFANQSDEWKNNVENGTATQEEYVKWLKSEKDKRIEREVL